MEALIVDSDEKASFALKATLLSHSFGNQWKHIQTETRFSPERVCDFTILSLNSENELAQFLNTLPHSPFPPSIILLGEGLQTDHFALLRSLGVRECFYKEGANLQISFLLSLLRKQQTSNYTTETLQGESIAHFFVGETLTQNLNCVKKIINSPLRSALILGESGTGKELVADMFRLSLPQGTPFLSINCATFCKDLLFSELFGHKKGSFTGALEDKKGLFESANHGWIFLDELACMRAQAQAALLRVLENGQIRQLGSNQTKTTDVRILAATNGDLESLVRRGQFRSDLLARLKGYVIHLPPLRQRGLEEKETILNFLLHKINQSHRGRKNFKINKEVRQLLIAFPFRDGNIRELWNVLQTCTINALGEDITIGALPASFCRDFIKHTQTKKGGFKKIEKP